MYEPWFDCCTSRLGADGVRRSCADGQKQAVRQGWMWLRLQWLRQRPLLPSPEGTVPPLTAVLSGGTLCLRPLLPAFSLLLRVLCYELFPGRPPGQNCPGGLSAVDKPEEVGYNSTCVTCVPTRPGCRNRFLQRGWIEHPPPDETDGVRLSAPAGCPKTSYAPVTQLDRAHPS